MKRIVSAILVCVLLVSSMFMLTSCGKSLSGEYKDDLTNNVTYKFGAFGKVTLSIDSIIGEDKVYEGKYEIEGEDDDLEITFTFEDEDANKVYGGTSDFAQGEENGKKYIKIGFLTYSKVD